MFGQQKRMRWKDIQRIAVRPALQSFVLENNKQKIAVDMTMVGFDSFLNTMKKELDPALHEDIAREMNKVSRSGATLSNREVSIGGIYWTKFECISS